MNRSVDNVTRAAKRARGYGMFAGMGLVRRFALRSGLFALLIVVSLTFTSYYVMERMHVRMAAETTELTANGALSGALGREDLSAPFVGSNRLRMDALTAVLSEQGVSAVKLWGSGGQLLYSSDPSDPVGASFRDEEALLTALTGRLGVEVTHAADPEVVNQFERVGSLIEVYAPLRLGGDNSVSGVFEIYRPYAPVAADARRSTLLLLAVILALLALAYVMQVRIVRSAADDLAHLGAEQDRLKARLQNSLQDLEDHLVGTLQALTATVDAKDSYTASHALNVTRYACEIGSRMGLDGAELADLERASLLHDIGKIGIPELVLNKVGKLTPEEYDLLKSHAEVGSRIVETIPALTGISEIVRHHHERWDGLGYPDGLRGHEISVSARVLAVADAFDAMTTTRPYRKAMQLSFARRELETGRGRQFDPVCVDALLDLLGEQGQDFMQPRGHGHKHRHLAGHAA